MINLLLYLTYLGLMIIKQPVLDKFETCKHFEYRTFVDLLDNIIPATLDVYAILFREDHFDEYIQTIFRL